jgi:hypothetical protein
LIAALSARRPVKLAAAEYVDVDVVNGLAAVALAVDDKPRSFFSAAQFFCQLLGFIENLPQKAAVSRFQVHNARDMPFRDDEEMHRRLWVHIMKGKHIVILVDFLAGDFPLNNFTENTVTHTFYYIILLCFFIASILYFIHSSIIQPMPIAAGFMPNSDFFTILDTWFMLADFKTPLEVFAVALSG